MTDDISRRKAQLLCDLLGEIRANITRASNYTFTPEQSPCWLSMKASFTRDTSYPYNNYITIDSIKEELLEALRKEYPDCTVMYEDSPHVTYTIDKTRSEYRGILKTLFAYLP